MNKFTKITLVLFGFGVIASPVYADTRVSGNYHATTTWTISESPYLLTGDVTVSDEATLIIEPGVVIRPAPEAVTDYVSTNPSIYVRGGRLVMNGSADKHISVSALGGISISGDPTGVGSLVMKYVNISSSTELSLVDALGAISSSTISGASVGLRTKNSRVSIDGSDIRANEIGINIDPHRPILIRRNDDKFGAGGYGDASAYLDEDPAPPSMVIRNSSFAGNSFRSILNNSDGEVVVDASKNWWGSTDGPGVDVPNSTYGEVIYAPWLVTKPAQDTMVAKVCCSSVIFIPGLEGTRLYTGSNQLWEPNRNDDIKKLFLDKNGSSTLAGIYSGGPIDKGLGIVDIYGKFMNFMDGLVKSGDIPDWHAFGYDWRKSVQDIVIGDESREVGTESLISDVVATASTSKTGKVTLITHSTGGLVAKYLTKVLTDMGKSDLVDSVISVAVPYLGTPEAIAGLLHGDHQSMLGGLIGSQANMRELGSNMASAYALLPSAGYFSRIFSPTIAYASPTMDTYSKQKSFILDEERRRSVPKASAVESPIIGNSILMNVAEIVHAALDPFEWPSTLARWAIVGWNKDTTKSLAYEFKDRCNYSSFKLVCKSIIEHENQLTKMGDGTVVAPSATYKGGKLVSVDLNDISKKEGYDISHANILGASSTQRIIASIIKNKYSEEPFELPSGVSWGEPDYSKEGNTLKLSTHSPVELHVYDDEGHHTGQIAKPVSLTNNDFIVGAYEEKIPGSSFKAIENSDGHFETYISLPAGAGDKYRVVIEGTDFGFFTFEVEQFIAGNRVEKTVYDMQPVTPLMIATTSVAVNISDGVPLPIASSTPKLSVDIDGNGSVDYVALTGGTGWPGNATSSDAAEKVATKLSLESLRLTIKSLDLSSARREMMLKKLDRVADLYSRGKSKRAEKKLDKISKKLGHIQLKNAKATDKKILADRIEGDLDDALSGQ